MNGIRVAQIPEDLNEEDLRIYFSNRENAGGKINKIYFPLLNNDAVIFFRNPETVDLLLSRNHRIDGHNVNIARTENMIFSKISAKLSPEITSLVAVSKRIKERLQYVIDVDLEEDPEDHCIVISGDFYQIELAWNTINYSLKTQQKIHSHIYQTQESRDGDRGRTRKSRAEDTSGRSLTVNDTLTSKIRTVPVDQNGSGGDGLGINSISQSSHKDLESNARKSPDPSNRRPSKKSSAQKKDLAAHSTSYNPEARIYPKTNTTSKQDLWDDEETIPMQSGSFNHISQGQTRNHERSLKDLSLLSIDYENISTSDQFRTKSYVNDPKIEVKEMGNISDTDEEEVQQFFKSSKGSTDSERSRQANDTFREFSAASRTSPLISFPQEVTTNKPSLFSTDFSLSSHQEFTIGDVKVVATLQNITAVETDVLVNAANGSLFNGAGVAGAISRAADHQLEIECEDYIRENGNMKTTEVMHTCAGGCLKVKYILHAVGPVWLDSRPERCTYELIQTYRNCFDYANSVLSCCSISVPCISSGIFGAPLDSSIQCFIDAVLLYYDANCTDEAKTLKEICMVNNDEDAVVTTIVIIQSLLEGGLARAVTAAKERFQALKDKLKVSMSSYENVVDDMSPKSLPAFGGTSRVRRTASLDRKSPRTNVGDRHEFRTTTLRPETKKLTTSTKTLMSNIDLKKPNKGAGKSPVVKQTLTNPTSLRPKTTPSKSSRTKPGSYVTTHMTDHVGSYGLERDFDGMSSLPAHLTYQDERNNCPICFDRMILPKELEKCGHKFCQRCIDRHFSSGKPVCPTCGTLYGIIKGDQPLASMSYRIERAIKLPGYYDCDGAIVIQYDVPSGIQMSYHPNPGKRYKALKRKAYLPNNSEGRQIYQLLRRAFDNKLIFTIGASRTTGKEDVVTWNDIHHKTSPDGGPTKFGYPDPTYLNRVREELATKGIV